MKKTLEFLCFKKRYILYVLILTFFATFLFCENECSESSIAFAQKQYLIGNFYEVIDYLNPCIEADIPERQKFQVYKLLTQTYLALDSLDTAIYYGSKLLKINPNYQPDYFDSPKYVDLINQIRAKGISTQITSVSKKVENLLEAPATVMVITDEEIQERGYQDLEAIFSDLPGFDISRTYSVSYSNLYQRGYRSNNTERTLLLIDGVEENDLWTNAAMISCQYPITNVKRIEVVYGPASTMYGANALIGVVNIITKDFEDYKSKYPITAQAYVGGGTYNTKYADLSIAGSSGGVSFVTTGRLYFSDERDLSEYDEFDYDPNDYYNVDYKNILSVYDDLDTEDINEANEYVINNGLTTGSDYYNLLTDENGDIIGVELTDFGEEEARRMEIEALDDSLNNRKIGYSNKLENFLITGKIKISNFRLGYQLWKYTSGGTNYFNDNNEAGAKNGSVWSPKESFFYAKFDKELNDNLLISNFAQYRTSEVDDNSRAVFLLNYSNGSFMIPELTYGVQPMWLTVYFYQISRQFKNELKMIYSPDNFDFVTGLEIRNSDIQGDYLTTMNDSDSVIDVGDVGSIPGGNNFSIYDIGYYAQGTYKFRNNLRFTLGGRYDYNRIRTSGGYGSQFNPRVGLVYTYKKCIFKAIYASAFQNANNWTKFSTNPARLLPNPNLEPEEVKNYELGLTYNFNNKSRAEVVFYNSKYDGVVGTAIVPYGEGTTGQNQAIGMLKIYGIQANFIYSFRNYKLYTNYTYTNPQENILNEDGTTSGEYRRIGDISSHRVNSGINAKYFEKINFNIRMNYMSERPVGPDTSVDRNPGDFPAVTIFNGSIKYDNLLPGLSIQASCNNILNKEYFDPGIRSADGGFYSYRTPQRERFLTLRLIYDF